MPRTTAATVPTFDGNGATMQHVADLDWLATA